MCVICVSEKGVRQPSEREIRMMFEKNPHGAGYMVARDGRVRIEKGFMNVNALLMTLKEERFGKDDVVVYHFRISTQAGVCQQMTQPFPLSDRLEHMKATSVDCECGIAHNGVIPLTTDPREKEFSDTAMFIAFYLSDIVTRPDDLHDEDVLDDIETLIRSKMVLLDGSGDLAYIGKWYDLNGLKCSNLYFLKRSEIQKRWFSLLEKVS